MTDVIQQVKANASGERVTGLRLAAVVGLAVCSGASFGETHTGSGYLSVSDPNWFGAYTSIAFGEGTLDYTGGDATVAVPLAFNPSGTRKISTVKVAEGQTLTLVASDRLLSSGGLVKTGTGALAVAGVPGKTLDFRNSTAVVSDGQASDVAWDANGCVTQGYVTQGLNVHEGEVTIRDATVDFGNQLHVGSMGSGNDSVLRIENARVKTLGSLTVGSFGKNSSTAGRHPTSRFLAKNTVFEGVGPIYLDRHANGFAYPSGTVLAGEMTFDNCIVTNTDAFRMDPEGGGVRSQTTLTLDNGTWFVSKGGRGLSGGANVCIATNRVNVLNGSTFLANSFGYDHYWEKGKGFAELTVGKNAVFGFMRTQSDQTGARWSTARFDGGTLRVWSSWVERVFNTSPAGKCCGQLFDTWDSISVASGGMTLFAPAHFYAYCYPAIVPDAASPGGRITVTGGGAFAISPTSLPIDVKDGSTLVLTPRHFLCENYGLPAANGNRIEQNPRIDNSSVTVEDGSSIRVYGYPQTLMNMTLPAGAISFSASGNREPRSNRYATGERAWAKYGSSDNSGFVGDGAVSLFNGCNDNPSQAEQIVYSNKLDLTRSFRITFEYSNAPLCDRVVKGIAAYIQNDARGVAARGDGNQGLGYSTNGTEKVAQRIDRSVAMVLKTWNDPGLYFGRNGEVIMSTRQTFSQNVNYNLQPDRLAPLVVTLEYDASAKEFSYHVSSPYGLVNCGASRGSSDFRLGNTVSADLSSICGATGYFGISTSADGGSPMQLQIANMSVRYLDETDRPCTDVAGRLALGAGTARLSAYGTDSAAGFAMNELQFADGGTLDIASTNLAYGTEDTAFVAFDSWKGTGMVTKTGAGNLGLRTATGAALGLADGGLVLRRDFDEEKYTVDPDRQEWIAVNWRNTQNDEELPLYAQGEAGVWCGTTDTGISGSTALKRKIKVGGKWRLSFDYESAKEAGAYGVFLTFHNDPRGYLAATDRGYVSGKEYAEPYALKGNPVSKSIRSCAAIQFYNYAESDSKSEANHRIKWWQSDAAGTFVANGVDLGYTKKDDSGNEQIYIANYDLKNVGSKVARKFHCEITSDDTLENPLTIRLTQTQGADGAEGAMRTWQQSFARNIPAAVGDDFCHFGLFYSTGGQYTRAKLKNFTFERLDGETPVTPSYFARVDVTAPAAKVYLDSAKEVTYRLADAVNVTGSLTVKSIRAAGTLDLGAATVAEGATVAADGATVRLTSGLSLGDRANLSVANGGRLLLDFAGRAQVGTFTIDGKTYRRGTFDAKSCSAIAGEGSLLVGRGMTVIVK